MIDFDFDKLVRKALWVLVFLAGLLIGFNVGLNTCLDPVGESSQYEGNHTERESRQ